MEFIGIPLPSCVCTEITSKRSSELSRRGSRATEPSDILPGRSARSINRSLGYPRPSNGRSTEVLVLSDTGSTVPRRR